MNMTMRICVVGLVVCLSVSAASAGPAQEKPVSPAMGLYRTLRVFDLSGGMSRAENLTLKRDRGIMTFNGTFYFEKAIENRVYGAVFVGEGTFHADPPPSDFERQNLRRLLNADSIDSDFHTAVLRFTDDTFDLISGNLQKEGEPDKDAKTLAAKFEPLLLAQTGANISARLSVSILNGEQPGFFVAQFEKGKRGAFTYLLDYQCRIPLAAFGLDAGEKGVIFAHNYYLFNEVWLAFYALDDYERGRIAFSDTFDLVAIPKYTMQIDLTNPRKLLSEQVRMEVSTLTGGLRAIPLMLNDSLGEWDNERLKKAMRVVSVRSPEGGTMEFIQEDWDGGVTLLLHEARKAGDKFGVELSIQGNSTFHADSSVTGLAYLGDCFYPLSTGGWYPRHSALKRSTYDLTFRHKKDDVVVSVGRRVREDVAADDNSEKVTQWKMDTPVMFVTFAVGGFRRTSEIEKRAEGDIPIEFFAPPGGPKVDFMLAELGNCLRFFSTMFGAYPYSSFGAVYHPRPFGQGFPTLLLLARSDSATKEDFSFIAHETSHQWWGDVVAWRSYRDQWLSEGFANYSGVLYTAHRNNPKSSLQLVDGMRTSLLSPPHTDRGVAKGRLEDIGPLVLGYRLSTRVSLEAYTTLIYNKGALVLRMLHFLFTDPNTGIGQSFFNMMSDFVTRYAGRSAATEDFIAVANQHFTDTVIGRKLQMKDLNWFFDQWVYQTALPSYELDYDIEPQPDGSFLLQGTLSQDDVPNDWFMPLPLLIEMGKGRQARGVIYARGPQSPVRIKIRERPTKVELDPDHWILSAKTLTRHAK
jgi:hypothetical protein